MKGKIIWFFNRNDFEMVRNFVFGMHARHPAAAVFEKRVVNAPKFYRKLLSVQNLFDDTCMSTLPLKTKNLKKCFLKTARK